VDFEELSQGIDSVTRAMMARVQIGVIAGEGHADQAVRGHQRLEQFQQLRPIEAARAEIVDGRENLIVEHIKIQMNPESSSALFQPLPHDVADDAWVTRNQG
jgi:hypothetical protein